MDAAQKVINAKAQEFLAALAGGKIEWTKEEIATYFLETKKKDELITVPEHTLGPMDPARSPLVARVFAATLGGSLEAPGGGKFVFTLPEGAKAQLPTVVERVVEKIVEKVVEVPAKRSSEKTTNDAHLQMPSTPKTQELVPNYQTPVWYKRMEAALNAGKHVSLAGPPGIGKSTAPEQYFIRRGQPFVVVNGDAGFRRRDIEGNVEVQTGTTFFAVAEFAAAAINGWGCILNEVNAADPDALMWINGIIETPHVVTVHGRAFRVHPNFRLVVTYNPGLIGTKALPQAFKDRFFPVKVVFPPRQFLKRLVVAHAGMSENAAYADRLLKYASDAWTLHEKGNLRYQISPRRLFDVVFLMDTGVCSTLEDAIKQGIIDAVDSVADASMLTTLITSPLKEIGAVSQFA